MDKASFMIEGKRYEFPTRIRMGDWALIREISGLEAEDFGERFDAAGGNGVDPTVIAALVAVGVWQANPRWSRDKAIRYAQSLDFDELIGTIEAGDEHPEAQGAESPSADTSNGSTASPEDSPEADLS